MIDWTETNEKQTERRRICLRCDEWTGRRCRSWQLALGGGQPWTGIDGVCPLRKWTIVSLKQENEPRRK